MRIDVTLQRQSIFIIGIVVVGITSFFVAFALAVGGPSLQSSHMLGVGMALEANTDDLNTQDTEMEENYLVPVAFEYCVGPFDTEPGEIKLVDYYFPYIDEETGELLPLPLCITNEMAQEWYWVVEVTGGYSPLDTYSYWPWMGITVWQDQNKDGVPEMIQGWNLDWTCENCDDPCCVPKTWRADVAWCGNDVCLHSNQYPELSGGLENYCNMVIPEGLTEIPGKEVYIHFGLLWEGCELDEQQFAYILAQKKINYPLKSPAPDLELKCSVVSCPR
jgi:hypothetical protein